MDDKPFCHLGSNCKWPECPHSCTNKGEPYDWNTICSIASPLNNMYRRGKRADTPTHYDYEKPRNEKNEADT